MTYENRLKWHEHCVKLGIPSPYEKEFAQQKKLEDKPKKEKKK